MRCASPAAGAASARRVTLLPEPDRRAGRASRPPAASWSTPLTACTFRSPEKRTCRSRISTSALMRPPELHPAQGSCCGGAGDDHETGRAMNRPRPTAVSGGGVCAQTASANGQRGFGFIRGFHFVDDIRGRIDRVGRIARKRRGLRPTIRIRRRHGRQQRARIGVRGILEQGLDRPDFHDLAEIHDEHAVGNVADDIRSWLMKR